jgi:predicted RNA-binding Zn-ribbon protein involved in translation (DUF1610 family)
MDNFIELIKGIGFRMSHYKCPTCGDHHIGKR